MKFHVGASLLMGKIISVFSAHAYVLFEREDTCGRKKLEPKKMLNDF